MALNKKHPLYQEDLNAILSVSGFNLFRGKRFLITGATGLLGVCLIDALMKYNHQYASDIYIYAVGRSKKTAYTRLGDYFEDDHFCFIEQDVRYPLPSDIVADYIIPFASNTHPLAYSLFPIETIEINVRGAEYAIIKGMECGATVLYPSTVEVYGNARGEDIFTEDYTGELNLSTSRACYTESKRVSEAMCQAYIAEKGVKIKIARLSRVFGPTMLMGDTKASSQFIKGAILGEDIVLKSDGCQFYSYTYVVDAIVGLLTVLLNGDIGVAYNICNEKTNVHLKEFAQICAEFSGKSVVFDIPSEAERRGYSVAVNAILANDRIKAIGFRPLYDIRSAIYRTIEILR